MAKTKPKQKLTTKQMAFVCAYLQCFNATKAAKQAGYSDDTAYKSGSENLHKPLIKEEISNRLHTEGITPDRINVAWSQIAFDADMADFEQAIKSGKSLKALRAEGYNTQLIKSLTVTETKDGGTTKVELYSRTDALDKITKIAGMYVDKIEHSGQLDILAALRTEHGGATDDRLARAARTAGIADAGHPNGKVGDS